MTSPKGDGEATLGIKINDPVELSNNETLRDEERGPPGGGGEATTKTELIGVGAKRVYDEEPN